MEYLDIFNSLVRGTCTEETEHIVGVDLSSVYFDFDTLDMLEVGEQYVSWSETGISGPADGDASRLEGGSHVEAGYIVPKGSCIQFLQYTCVCAYYMFRCL